MNAAAKKKRPVFDTIKMIDKLKDNTGTVWQGEKGVYVIRHTGRKAPVAHVMLNSKYLTGLFKTRHKGIFSGDIKTGAGKVYLLFLSHDHENNIKIVQKSTPSQAEIA